MFYLKLFLIVIAGSIGIWLAVYKLVSSTDRMTDSFTVDSASVAQRRKEEAAKAEAKDNHSTDVSVQDNRASKISGEVMTVTAKSDPNSEEQALVAELATVVEEEPDTQSNVDKSVKIERETQQAGNQARKSEASEARRADSDADMQSDNETDGERDNTNLTESTQDKTMELDLKLLDTNKLNNAIEEDEPDTIRALDIAYAAPSDSNCVIPGDDKYPRIGIRFRPSSYAINRTKPDKYRQAHCRIQKMWRHNAGDGQ